MTGARMIDASAWVGSWPFGSGRHEALRELATLLRGVGIGGAMVSPIRAVLGPETTSPNRELLDAIVGWDDPDVAIWLAPIVDPTFPGWQRDLADLLDTAGEHIRAVRIVPSYHGFALDDAPIDRLAEVLIARDLPLIVQVRMLDERAHPPLMKVSPVPIAAIVALAERHAALRIVVAGVFFAELSALAIIERVAIELSAVEADATLPRVLELIAVDRVLLGTHAPLHDPLPGVVKANGPGIAQVDQAAVAGENARRWFRLPV